MFSIAFLGSGSSGNAVLIRHAGTLLMIDAGMSAGRLISRMAQLGVQPDEVSAIILTHEHGDHSSALNILLKKHDIPVYATRHTRTVLAERTQHGRWIIFDKEQSFNIGEVIITPFAIPHDAVDPVAFRIESECGRAAMGYLADCGHITPSITNQLMQLDTLILEANYDPAMLMTTTKRPYPLKVRIASTHGHLSNEQAAELVAQVAHDQLRTIVLTHLSAESNTPELARSVIQAALHACGAHHTRLMHAERGEITPWFTT